MLKTATKFLTKAALPAPKAMARSLNEMSKFSFHAGAPGHQHDHHHHPKDVNDATSVFLESVTSTIKGIQHVNYIEEFDPNLSTEEKAQMKRFLIYRSNPAVRILFLLLRKKEKKRK